jgi:hypothetical protein
MGMEFELSPRQAGSANVQRTSAGWRLELPAGPPRTYRLAQLDDYARMPRSRLKHKPPWTFQVRARASSIDLPGTWGFGLWNDPFGLSLGFGGGKPLRLPTLPQTAWFMQASRPNWLSLRDDPERVPPNGFFAGTFRSPNLPAWLFAPGLLALPLCAIRPISRWLRRLASRIIQQDAARVDLDVTLWHEYSIQWSPEGCLFRVDGLTILQTACSPVPPLGLVLWIDNQYAAWTPQGNLGYGMLENPPAWLEIEKMEIMASGYLNPNRSPAPQ